MIYRLIALNKPVLEGEFTANEIKTHNAAGYNIYYLPNYPSSFKRGTPITGSDIDVYSWVFVDMDLKDGKFASKEDFLETIGCAGITPTRIVDSGNGVHVYWKVLNLDAKSYLRFQRRLSKLYSTDEAVGQLFQLMRVPGTMNTKIPGEHISCTEIYNADIEYTCEDFDKLLPPITLEDEAYCVQHYDRTFNLHQETNVDESLPGNFGRFIKDIPEAKEIFAGDLDDRSKGDYRLGHLMFAYGFTKPEAMSVLVNSAKALKRAPIHRISYAQNIVDKIWTFEETKDTTNLSPTVKDILSKGDDTVRGIRFPCNKIIDDTVHGFRLGQVIKAL